MSGRAIAVGQIAWRGLSRTFSFTLLVGFSFELTALEISGEWTQGGMLLGKVVPGSAVAFMGRSPRVSEQGEFVIGLGRDAPPHVTITVTSNGETKSVTFNVTQRQYREQRIEGVPQETVTPPDHVTARIKEEARQVWLARNNNTPERDFIAGFSKPLEGPVTGVYGSRRVYNGIPKRPHYGLDIAAPEGVPVVAPAPGLVTLAHEDMYFSGGTLVIDHGHGLSSSFIHLSAILVQPGQRVSRGDPVARVGASGRATGSHLDWRMNWFDVRIDPALVLRNFPFAAEATD